MSETGKGTGRIMDKLQGLLGFIVVVILIWAKVRDMR
jgi:hypothetical protein